MAPETITDMLGLRREGALPPLHLLTAVEQGLPLAALDRLAEAVAPGDAQFTYRMIPRATLARRRRALADDSPSDVSRLSADEGARVARLAAVWAMAHEVWGSEQAARDFLFRTHPLLEGRRPIDVVLASELGRPLVEGILGRLRFGAAV